MVTQMGERLAKPTGGEHAWLFGRRSYEYCWPSRMPGAAARSKDALNHVHKYVGSSNPATVVAPRVGFGCHGCATDQSGDGCIADLGDLP
jgi:hypothetical protein